MQTEAIVSAAINVWKEDDLHITPEIMVPLVSEVNELRFVKKVIKAKADELIEQSGLKMKYMVGTMIETPRAAVTAGDVAKEAEFFSFGTNEPHPDDLRRSPVMTWAAFWRLTSTRRSSSPIRSLVWTRTA